MNRKKERIFLGTVLLERNRWGKEDRSPTFQVSDWTRRIADDGFDGLELWENHVLLADAEERERLRAGPVPVALLNSYAGCEDEDLADRQRSAEMANYLGAEGMKYNFGKSSESLDTYIENVKDWYNMFTPGFRMLCECHRGTLTADPDLAKNVFERLGEERSGAIIHFDNDEETYRRRFGCYGGCLTHIHCKLSSEDSMMTEDEVRRHIAWLREFNFSGTYTIEFTEGVRGGLSIEDLYRNAVRDLQFLRRCLDS